MHILPVKQYLGLLEGMCKNVRSLRCSAI